jgi:hypothetical protein
MDRIIYSTDGSLEVFRSGVVRENFSRHHTTINTVADFKASLRAGRYVWPGGYPIVFLLWDGCILCHTCAKIEFKQIADAIKHRDTNKQWQVVGCRVCEDLANSDERTCDHCGDKIE